MRTNKADVGWWASDSPIHLADGYRFGEPKTLRPISLSVDKRLRHVYVTGSSGSGKSKLAELMALADILANRGLSFCDPHGDLVESLLAFIANLAIPGPISKNQGYQLGNKLILIDVEDPQRYGVPGINILRPAPGQLPYVVIDAIIESIRELWPDCFGPRLEDITRNGLLLLQELGLTVVEMIPLLSNDQFRAALVARSRNQQLRNYFEEHLGGLRPSELKAWVESSRNKWSAFISHPVIRLILGQLNSTIDFRRMMDNGQWCFLRLSHDKLKESRRLLGALLVNAIHSAAVSRQDIPPSERVFHPLIVDEFAECWTPVYISILTGARKRALGLTLLQQNLTQPPFDKNPGLIDTIVANTHCRVIFSASRQDAQRLAGEIFFPTGQEVKFQRSFLGIPLEKPQSWSMGDEREFYSAELMRQGPGEAFVSFKGVPGDEQPYVARIPRVADPKCDPEKVDLLRQHVSSIYCRPMREVEQEIEQRWNRILQEVPTQQSNDVDYLQ